VRLLRRATLVLPALAMLALATTACSQKADSKATFAGKWDWSQGGEELTLTLEQDGSHLRGWHAAIGQGGAKADEVSRDQPPSISGDVQGVTANVKFTSGYPDSKGGGRARLTLQDEFLIWQILESDGEHYLPRSAKLTRETK